MRTACRKFLNEIENKDNREIVTFARNHRHWASWKFYGDLGIMRGVFGLHIALIGASYGLDIEDDLASILPNIDEHQEDGVTKLKLKQ